MVSSRSLLLLAAVLGAAAAASSHAPNRWGLQAPQAQKPPQSSHPPPPVEAQPAPAQNTTGAAEGDMQQILSQMMTIMMPKIQAKLQVLMGNVWRAIAGAMYATFKTGFKIPLTPTFAPLESPSVASKFPFNSLDAHPTGYITRGYLAEEEGFRLTEPLEEAVQITEGQLR